MEKEYYITHKNLAFLIEEEAKILMRKTIEDIERNLGQTLCPYMYMNEVGKTKKRINDIIYNHNKKFFNINEKENDNRGSLIT